VSAGASFDVIIVGSGAAGATAAVDAANAGARVLVLEAMNKFGGTAAVSGGGTCIAGSPLQELRGIEDNPMQALEDWLSFGGPEADPEWARRYLEASVPELFVWLAELGVDWVTLNGQEGNRVPRWHAPAGAGGEIMAMLEKKARSMANIQIDLGARVVDLVQEAGRISGVIAETERGRVEYRAPAVLLASGGFNNNPEMVRTYTSELARGGRVLLGGGRGAVGGGHRLLEDLGAEFVNMDAVWMYPYGTPDPNDLPNNRGLVLRGMDGDIWVNGRGERFHNEAKRGGASGARALLALDPPTCWSIVDARVAGQIAVADPYYRRGATPDRERTWELLNTSPFMRHADSVADLGSAMGVDPGTLVETVKEHNRLLSSGASVDPQFGRPLARLEPLDTPPFYAIQFFPLARKNFGGVRTDLECHVLRPDGSAIPGLFAAGEVAGMAGGHINGRAGLEGTMIGPSLYSGRVAGRAMVNARSPIS
jgi:flavocytochrome c